jgi:hypothetical protein
LRNWECDFALFDQLKNDGLKYVSVSIANPENPFMGVMNKGIEKKFKQPLNKNLSKVGL